MRIPDARELLFMLSLTGLVILAGCIQPGCRDGVLEGTVQIGPLCPVEPCTLPPGDINPRYHIHISRAGSAKLVADTPLSENGSYQLTLCEGSYMVDLEPGGMWSAPGLPAPVTIREGRITRLNINMDTGIR